MFTSARFWGLWGQYNQEPISAILAAVGSWIE
jgi:hypothetical protein